MAWSDRRRPGALVALSAYLFALDRPAQDTDGATAATRRAVLRRAAVAAVALCVTTALEIGCR
ncbi:hypothetical protein [Streptomyces hygroscopicus]|uniref:hypothetical protein n=1 Tax=Streptomyces hygroscopicus TaxID=1912 RepID=UPI0007DB4CBA|nr:hypothetical protein [Streptomyces sp. NBRC 109436]